MYCLLTHLRPWCISWSSLPLSVGLSASVAVCLCLFCCVPSALDIFTCQAKAKADQEAAAKHQAAEEARKKAEEEARRRAEEEARFVVVVVEVAVGVVVVGLLVG